MSPKTKKYKLFEVTGIELEYMVVDRDTLKVLPIVDKLFEDVTGAITSDVERGDVEWSNELVSHVVELKTAKPTKKIPPFVYQPRHHRLRGVGEVIGKLPLPGDPIAGFLGHRARLKTVVRSSRPR